MAEITSEVVNQTNLTRNVVASPNYPVSDGAPAVPTTGQIWPRGK